MKLSEAYGVMAQLKKDDARVRGTRPDGTFASEDPTEGAKIEGDVLRFVLAGHATFTVVSKRTGARFTYRVKKAKRREGKLQVWFVSLLTGPDNDANYEYIGIVDDRGNFRHAFSSRIQPGAPGARAFRWFIFAASTRSPFLSTCEVWHAGRCGRCRRRLTVPESIASGLGPECAGRAS